MPNGVSVCPQCGATVSAPPPPGPAMTAAAPAPAPWQGTPAARPNIGYQQTDGKAVSSLILGILAIFPFGFLAGIPAVVFGHLSRKSIRESMGRLKGDGMAIAGLVMGYISVAAVPLLVIIAAIAIPSLLQSRMLANQSAAVSTVRTLNMSQLQYSLTYPSAGYARDLATLGPGSAGPCSESKGNLEHACLIDSTLGNSRCTAGSWCVKYGYKFQVAATCGSDGICSDYVIVATPVYPGTTGRKSFCATPDAIVREKPPGAIFIPPTVAECQAWHPIGESF